MSCHNSHSCHFWCLTLCHYLIGWQDGGFRQHLQRAQHVHGGANWSLRHNFPRNWTLVGHPRWTGPGHKHTWWYCHCLCYPGALHQKGESVWIDTLYWWNQTRDRFASVVMQVFDCMCLWDLQTAVTFSPERPWQQNQTCFNLHCYAVKWKAAMKRSVNYWQLDS